MSLAPVEQGLQHRAQLFAFWGQQVFGARRVLLIETPLDDPGFLQPLQSGRQRVGADPGQRALEILKLAGSASDEITQN